MPFIRSWSVLLKQLPALPGGHVCILCFSNAVVGKQQQRGKQLRLEVRRGCLEQDRGGRCRVEGGRWAPGGLLRTERDAAVISPHPGEPAHTHASTHQSVHTFTNEHKHIHRYKRTRTHTQKIPKKEIKKSKSGAKTRTILARCLFTELKLEEEDWSNLPLISLWICSQGRVRQRLWCAVC